MKNQKWNCWKSGKDNHVRSEKPGKTPWFHNLKSKPMNLSMTSSMTDQETKTTSPYLLIFLMKLPESWKILTQTSKEWRTIFDGCKELSGLVINEGKDKGKRIGDKFKYIKLYGVDIPPRKIERKLHWKKEENQ